MVKFYPKKRKTLLVILGCLVAIGGLFVYARYARINADKNRQDGADEDGLFLEQPSKKYDVAYSFYTDTDLDGLSNAEEIIWGSNPKIVDTDNDGYKDGDEIKNGYDPLLSGVGKGRLEERTSLTLSQKYFLWLRNQKNIQNPVLEQKLVQEFLSQDKNFDLPVVSTSEIKIAENSGAEVLKNYLEEILNIAALPESYVKLSQKASDGDGKSVSGASKFINENKNRLAAMAVPRSAVEIHKKYLGIFESLSQMIGDLNNIEQDPVQIASNILKGQHLIQVARELEKEKLSLTE